VLVLKARVLALVLVSLSVVLGLEVCGFCLGLMKASSESESVPKRCDTQVQAF